jgi:hypothetical protein
LKCHRKECQRATRSRQIRLSAVREHTWSMQMDGPYPKRPFRRGQTLTRREMIFPKNNSGGHKDSERRTISIGTTVIALQIHGTSGNTSEIFDLI